MLSSFGKREWMTILAVGGVIFIGCLLMRYWWLAGMVLVATLCGLAFFRDPRRPIPMLRGLAVSPADGKVTAVDDLEYFEPFAGPARRVRIFLSVFDVHVNRAPLQGRVVSVERIAGEHRNALKAGSADRNESALIVLHHPATKQPVAAVRQIVGAVARRIVCQTTIGDILQRGQRYGMIKFGSTVELFLPNPRQLAMQVAVGDRVRGGATVIAELGDQAAAPSPKPEGRDTTESVI
jgi:phosphatidylserine decarboxylase